MAKRDYYEVLGVERDRKRGRAQGRVPQARHADHPDRNPGDKDCEHRFKEINEAYDILKDPRQARRL